MSMGRTTQVYVAESKKAGMAMVFSIIIEV
jgi:hypothetical protein